MNKNNMSWIMYCFGILLIAPNICDKLSLYETIICVIGIILIRESGIKYGRMNSICV